MSTLFHHSSECQMDVSIKPLECVWPSGMPHVAYDALTTDFGRCWISLDKLWRRIYPPAPVIERCHALLAFLPCSKSLTESTTLILGPLQLLEGLSS